MSYQLSIEATPTYLHCIVTGENRAENVTRYMEEVVRECVRRGIARVLIEERLEGPRLSMIEVFSMVKEGSARFQGRLEAMAYVDVNAQGESMRFAEDVAVNRGFPVRVFASVAAAAAWLSAAPRG